MSEHLDKILGEAMSHYVDDITTSSVGPSEARLQERLRRERWRRRGMVAAGAAASAVALAGGALLLNQGDDKAPDRPGAQATSSVPSGTPLPASLQGTFVAREKGKLVSTFVLTGSTFSQQSPGLPLTRGKVALAPGNLLVFSDQSSCAPGGYDSVHYSLVGATLTLTDLVHVGCDAIGGLRGLPHTRG